MLSDQQILGELLTFNAAPCARFDSKTGVQQTGQHLNGIQFAVPVQWKSNDLPTVKLIPCDIGAAIENGLIRFGEYFIEYKTFSRQHDAFTQIRRYMKRNNLVRVHRLHAIRMIFHARWIQWRCRCAEHIHCRCIAIPNDSILFRLFQLFDHRCKLVKWKTF